ncbi:MAG: DNA primase [Desulfoplanes sp.]|nr:DNA primase [Desulfoplanes sp.]
MSRFDSRTVDAIKAKVDILELIGRYVELRPVGANWVAPCPFHQETKPSFSVNPARGFYYCFGCQAAGDVIEFYRAMNGLSFPEAVEQLAREAGIELMAEGPGAHRHREEKTLCLDLHAQAQMFFRAMLQGREGEKAREYLKKRSISEKTKESFGLGWGSDAWNGLANHLKKKGYSEDDCVTAGLVSRSQSGRVYDRFRARVIFPIYNLAGQVVAFGGRSIEPDQDPKYLNSSETPIYIKGNHLYGLFQARRAISTQKSVLLTEGYVDVLTLHQHGFSNACGVLGTALTPEQVHRLAGLAGHIDLLFDGDGAGRKAALRSAQMILTEGIRCQVVLLPDGEDADSILRDHGSDVFRELQANAPDGLAFCLDVVKGYGSSRDVMAWSLAFVRSLKDVSWRAFYIPKIAAGLGISEQELRQAIGGSSSGTSHKLDKLHLFGPAQRDRELLSFAIRFPEYLGRLEECHFASSLCTQRGQNFWKKLRSFGHKDLVAHLDDGERRFFVRCQMDSPQEENSGSEEWEALQEFLLHAASKKRQKHLKMALTKAQQEGDLTEIKRILTEFQSIIVH